MNIEDVARQVVLNYHQTWGQSAQSRAKTLEKAAKFCGLNVTRTVETWVGHPLEVVAAIELRADLDARFPLGCCNEEIREAMRVLANHKRPLVSRVWFKMVRPAPTAKEDK